LPYDAFIHKVSPTDNSAIAWQEIKKNIRNDDFIISFVEIRYKRNVSFSLIL
jgi:hypothetical protein